MFVGAMLALVEPVEIDFLWRPQLRDADDEMVIGSSDQRTGDAIVTFNRKDYGD